MFLKQVLVITMSIIAVVVYAAEVIRDNGELILRNKKVAISFQEKDLTLMQIRDLERKVDYLQNCDGRYFVIALWDKKNPGSEMMNHPRFSLAFAPGMSINGSTAEKFQHMVSKDKRGRTVLTLKYLNNKFSNFAGTVDVVATITLGDEDGMAEWRLSIENRTGKDILDVQFPRITGIASSAPGSKVTDSLIGPADSSHTVQYPRVNVSWKYFYPNCMSTQLVMYCDGKGGTLYYAAHDQNAYRKEYVARHADDKKSFMLCINAAGGEKNTVKWQSPYPTVIGVLSGDWYDGAKYYRRNFADRVWKKFSERNDVAPWFSNNSIWLMGGAVHQNPNEPMRSSTSEMDQFVDRMLRLRNILGEEFGLHWYVWHKHITFDQFYPDYLPARPDFSDAVTKLEAAGIHCMPYVNSHYFDRNLPEWHDGLLVQESIIKDIVPGRFDLKIYNMATMCHGTKFWRNRLVEIERGILGLYPVSALYLDEISSVPELCYADNHDHPAHGGNFYAKGQQEILRRIREAREWGKRKPVITGEGMSETHINLLDGSISGHTDMSPHSLPVFQTIHSDRLSAIGLRINLEDMKDMNRFMAKMGFTLVRGKQLGWFETKMVSETYDLTLPELRPTVEKLKECSAVRRAGQEFLFFGEMLRPPTFQTGAAEIIWSDHIPYRKEEKIRLEQNVPFVYGCTYRSPAGNIGIVLANRTANEQKISIPWNEKDWYFKIGDSVRYSEFSRGRWINQKKTTIKEQFELTLPPYTPVLLKFSR